MSDRWQKKTDRLDESAATRALLAATGIAAGDLTAMTAAIARRGWRWRITGDGTTNPHLCAAAIFSSRSGDVPWTEEQGDGPAAALGEAFARALSSPPPEDGEVAITHRDDWRFGDAPRVDG
jgi:hypothetical protein